VKLSGWTAACLALQCAGAWAQSNIGDVKRGADVFASQCAECHSTREGKQKKGPSVFGTVGRKAASQPGFEFSEALRASGWTWDQERLAFYLSQPSKKANPGSKMKYDGLTDQKDLSDLIAYLATLK
jgi:cytochrome c